MISCLKSSSPLLFAVKNPLVPPPSSTGAARLTALWLFWAVLTLSLHFRGHAIVRTQRSGPLPSCWDACAGVT